MVDDRSLLFNAWAAERLSSEAGLVLRVSALRSLCVAPLLLLEPLEALVGSVDVGRPRLDVSLVVPATGRPSKRARGDDGS